MNNEYITPFNSFESPSEVSKIDEGFADSLLTGLKMLGNGFGNAIKQKVASWILERFGIRELSPLSKLIQEIFEAIDIDEYYGIVSGKHNNWDFFIPKISEGLVEFLQVSGFDEIAESVGIEADGFLYKTLRESLSDRLAKRKDLDSDIQDFLRNIFKDKSPAETFKVDDIIDTMGSSERRETIKGLDKVAVKTGAEKVKPGGGEKKEASAVSGYIKDLLKDGGESFAKALAKK